MIKTLLLYKIIQHKKACFTIKSLPLKKGGDKLTIRNTDEKFFSLGTRKKRRSCLRRYKFTCKYRGGTVFYIAHSAEKSFSKVFTFALGVREHLPDF